MTKKDKSRTPKRLREQTSTEEGNSSLRKFGSETGEILSEEKQEKPSTIKAEKGKKDKPRTPTKLQENTSTQEGNGSLKKPGSEIDEIFAGKKQKKKPNSVIDDIFAGKKRKRPSKEKAEKPNYNNEISRPKKMKKKKDKGFNDGGFDDSSSRPKRKTNDGFTIYTEEELGLNKVDAGGTALCPFDCSCCF